MLVISMIKRGRAAGLIVLGDVLIKFGLAIISLWYLSLAGTVFLILSPFLLAIGIILILLGVNQHYRTFEHNFSKWLYLLPILLNLFGALIIYFVLKNRNPKAAESLAWLGVIIFLIGLITTMILAGIMYYSTPSPIMVENLISES